jgi:pimeloyl-ACP methyl ester carboxylesterase
MTMVEVAGDVFAYDEAGSGPMVVLAHGGTTDRGMWVHQVPVLAEHFRVIRYDWLGCGQSGDPVGDHARHEQLLALLDALDVDRAVLVGNSDGGKLSLDAALLAPERVSALVLVGSGLSGHVWPAEFLRLNAERVYTGVPAERLRRYYAGEADRIDPEDLERYVGALVELLTAGPGRRRDDLDPQVWELALRMYRRTTERAWSPAGRGGTARDLEPGARHRLDEIAVPTLVVSGAEDVPAILEVSDLLEQGIKDAVRVDLPATGHIPPLERPAEFNRILLDFLQAQ